ncbi:MAG: hypothetical protein ACJAYE_000734 [Candidatus Azotimanducaceae bacterium]|jgi:hypothetical protein
MLNQCARYATLFVLLINSPWSRSDALQNAYDSHDRDGFVASLRATSTKFTFRLNYEDVNSEQLDNASSASLRSRIRFETGEYRFAQFTLELENITNLTQENFSDGIRDEGTAVIADPDITEINQAYVRFNGVPRSILLLGRQVIKLDDERHIGAVDFRQNQQTFDGISVVSKPTAELSIFYAHLNAVNTIFGRKAADGRQHHDSHVFNLQYQFNERLSIAAYHYRLNNDDVLTGNHNTSGIRFSGQWPMAEVTPSLTLEYARQFPNLSQVPNVDLDHIHYQRIELMLKRGRFSLLLGSEMFMSEQNIAFQTPLATLHKFQGFTDQFLTTPVDGLRDQYATVRVNVGPGRVEFTAHQFESDGDRRRIGKEHSVGAWYRIGERGQLLLKWARFNGARPSGDVRKYWLQFSYSL